MQIDPSSLPPRSPAAPSLKRNERDGAPSGRSFAWRTVFGRAAALEALGGVRDGQSTFAAASVIGDSAERFDARPIVAPVAEAGRQALAHRSGGKHEALAAILPAGSVIERRLPEAAGSIPPAEATDATSPRAATVHGNRYAPATQPHGPSGSAVSQGAPPRALDAAGGKPTIGSAAPPLRYSVTTAAQRVTVHAVATGEEVRIVVRGTTLTAEDRAALVRVAEDTLADTPHAGRPIHVIGTRRGA